ncbi:MAG: hypothetical protein ACK59M_05225 [Pseudomonadota bacterium]
MKVSTRPSTSRAAVRKPDAMRTLLPDQTTLLALVDEVTRSVAVICAQVLRMERLNWKRANTSERSKGWALP